MLCLIESLHAVNKDRHILCLGFSDLKVYTHVYAYIRVRMYICKDVGMYVCIYINGLCRFVYSVDAHVTQTHTHVRTHRHKHTHNTVRLCILCIVHRPTANYVVCLICSCKHGLELYPTICKSAYSISQLNCTVHAYMCM